MKESYNGVLMEKGKENEKAIYEYFKQKGYFVVNVSDYSQTYKKDIDFLILTQSGKTFTIEVKSDKMISEEKNMFFETHRIYFPKNFYNGWGWRSKAKYLYVRNPNTHETFVFNMKTLRQKIIELAIEHILNDSHIKEINTDERKKTYGYAIPMNLIKDIYKKIKI